MAHHHSFSYAAMPGQLRPSTPVSIDWLTESTKEYLTDTGVRMAPRGELALCTLRGFEQMGITCGKCGRLSAMIRPWNRCEGCGDPLLNLLPNNLPSKTVQVDWRSGCCTEVPEIMGAAAEEPESNSLERKMAEIVASVKPAPKIIVADYPCGRGRRAALAMLKRPGPADCSSEAALQEGETSGIVSGGSETGSVPPDSEGITEIAAGLSEEVEKGEDIEITKSEKSWAELIEEESAEYALPPAPVGQAEETVQLLEATKRLGLSSSYQERQLEISPPRTFAQALAHSQANAELIKRAMDSCVPPGRGDVKELPRLSRLQRLVNKRVALEYGYEYPYVPLSVMEEIEDRRETWGDEGVWDYLGVPKPCRNKDFPTFWENFQNCKQNWSIGRYIFKDRVVIQKPGRTDSVYTTKFWDINGEVFHVPDPRFYK